MQRKAMTASQCCSSSVEMAKAVEKVQGAAEWQQEASPEDLRQKFEQSLYTKVVLPSDSLSHFMHVHQLATKS